MNSVTRRQIGRDFLVGVSLGAVASALVWYLYQGFGKEPPSAALDSALERRESLLAQARQDRAPALFAAPAQHLAESGPCGFEPMVPRASAADGNARAEHPFPASPRAKAKVFLRQAQQAASAGRARDAEVALIAACRQNERASAAPTVPLARVLGLLGDQYAAAASREPSDALREALVARARQVLVRSAEAYASALGPNASRSRQARQRVETLEGDVIAAADAQPQSLAGPLETVQARPVRSEAIARARPAGTPAAQARPGSVPAQQAGAPRAARPEPPVEADPELRQLASDLARLRAQAEAVSDDPAGLRRRVEIARAQRDQCRDAACLQEWYARRRRELLAEF